MKYIDALRQMAFGEPVPRGYMVEFERRRNGILASDHFPDLHAGETLTPSEEQARRMAELWARVEPRAVNIYVIDDSFIPAPNYEARKIRPYPVREAVDVAQDSP